MLLLIANSTIGHFLDQSFWLLATTIRSIWAIDLLAHSIAPSVWGWNVVDMRSLLPINLCNFFQNMEMNLVSLLDTIDSRIPWSLTTSFSINHATSLVVIVIVVGTRCTCDCYKFILIFNGEDCQNMFIPSRCLYAALDYVIDARECGRLDSCRIASCLCNNVHIDVRAYVMMST